MSRSHEILHVNAGASPDEIQQSYRDLVRVWHPDRFANDPRLRKIAEEKLREINAAYAALVCETQSPLAAPRALPARPRWWPLHPDTVRALWLAAVLAAAALIAFLPHPFRDTIATPARSAAPLPLPAPAAPFYGSGAGVSRSTRTAPPAGSQVPFRPGVGEIQLHNHTGEDTRVVLTSGRARSSAVRTLTVPVQGDVTVDNLGPDLYMLQVTFPNSRRPALRLGPLVMVEIESAAGKTSDRYEITLNSAIEH